jgi:hypothetical protein
MSDVRSFGAVGDGQADDTAAIEHALRDGEGDVEFPRGDYRITRSIVVELEKVGRTALVGHGTARVVMAGAGPAFRIVGTHLKGTADPADFDPKVWQQERMPVIDGLEIVGEHVEADGIDVVGTMQCTVTRVRISRCRHGIRLAERNRNVLIADCHIYHNRGIGVFFDEVSLHQSNIVGSHISYCGGGGVVCRGGDVRNLHIGTCDLESNHAHDGPPTANVLIDCTTSPGGTAEVAITGCTIQHNSKSPDSANIRILGRGAERNGRRAQWGHVTITGNILSDVATNLHLRGCRDVAVAGNTLWQAFANNLLVEDSTAVVLGANVLDRNPAYESGRNAEARNVVAFVDCRDSTITGLQVQGVHHVDAAVTLERCDRMNLSGCTLLDNDGTALLLKQVTRSQITGCMIRDDRPGASSPAVRAVECRDLVLFGNTFGRPIDIDNRGGRVEQNTLLDAGG